MSTITADELERVRALLKDIAGTARTIWDKAPNVGPLCVKIQNLSHSVTDVLDDITARNPNKNATLSHDDAPRVRATNRQ